MNFCIVIPAHNEESVLGSTLDSLVSQTLPPKELIIVDDNSTDATAQVVEFYSKKHPWIRLILNSSSDTHLPGAKIINAFYKGFEELSEEYDVICKFDADLIFPHNYLESIAMHFQSNNKLGMASGFCYIKENNDWKLENLTRRDHIRGALKAYRKECFRDIGGLKKSMGWDTVDELLAKYHGWEILTDPKLKVKHLKPTGESYGKAAKYLQGEAMYKMRNGFTITLITALKMALKKGNVGVLVDYLLGYSRAKRGKEKYLVTDDQGKFIRKLRWKGILNKFR